jgi:hypothetical protein
MVSSDAHTYTYRLANTNKYTHGQTESEVRPTSLVYQLIKSCSRVLLQLVMVRDRQGSLRK